MLSLRQLACFVAVAETGNVAEAATRLGISASPLSRQVQTLEDRLGVQLFERARKRLWLTTMGEAFLAEARELIAHAERIERRAMGSGATGSVTIGYVEAAVHGGLLAACVRRVRDAAPAVEITLRPLRSADQVAALCAREIDCALLHSLPEDREDLAATPLLTEPLLLAMPASDPLTDADAVRPADLDGRTWITRPRADNPAAHAAFLTACGAAGFDPEIRYEAADLLTLLGLVGAGLGMGLVQASIRHAAGSNVAFRSLPWFGMDIRVHGVRRHADRRPLIARMLADAPGRSSLAGRLPT